MLLVDIYHPPASDQMSQAIATVLADGSSTPLAGQRTVAILQKLFRNGSANMTELEVPPWPPSRTDLSTLESP